MVSSDTRKPIDNYYCDSTSSASDLGGGIRFEAGGKNWVCCGVGKRATGEKVGGYIREFSAKEK